MTTVRWLLAAVCTLALAARGQSAPWSIERINHITLAPPAGVTIAEMSGVTYLGPVGDAHRFLAVQQTKGELLQFDLSFGVNGAIAAVSGVVPVTINGTLDFEGIAYTNPVRHSVFLSEENNPGVREINLATGLALQTVAIPSVFTSHKRANRGFESLARSQDGTVMWTANEAALTVDGPLATAAAGTVVRLLRLDVNGNSVAAGSQFAYQVEPIHGSSSFGSPQSGLSELTLLPDGTLLAVERSVALTSPLYLNRIYAVDFDGATDVSVGPLAAGLTGQTYAPVSKQLLWSGAVDGASGQNMEGLALGPQLAGGAWVLIGVVDNQGGGDPVSGNTVVAFVATPQTTADFNADGIVDGADLLAWQRGLGRVVGASLADGDGNRDGAVDAADLAIWQGAYAPTVAASAPEPSAGALLGAALIVASWRRRTPATS